MRGNTKHLHLVFSVCVAFVLCAFASVASARTIYVPDDYEKIQWAIDNASAGDTIIVRPGTYNENVVVSKSLEIRSYSQNLSDTIVKANNSNDHVFHVTADNVYINGFTVTGANGLDTAGIYLSSSNNSRIENVNASNNWYGIYLWYSSNNTIANNNVSSNNIDGIDLCYSSNNNIANNTFHLNGMFVFDSYDNAVVNNTVNGKPLVYLENVNDYVVEEAGQVIAINSSNITIKDLDLSYASFGVEFWNTSNSIIANNNVSNNWQGIYLWYSSNNTIANNNVTNNDYGIHLRSSSNNIANNNVTNNGDGICLSFSSNSIIANNNVSNNWFGIRLYYSSNNTIANNNVMNNRFGIYLSSSSNNKIYLNNFINNTDNVFSYSSTNIWNSTEPITYTYNGNQYTNYLGNYWSDYKGSDADKDGIGDTPYIIDGDKDEYPLIEHFEHYFMPKKAQIFDTGRPENPYPSISGKFIGTIKTNKKIIATKLYTYACEGTGGHTEHALICNKTWCAYAEWDGYKGDWMNISFNKTVILMPYETYNITIVTGSYPQIHHTPSLKTENGWINCSEFTDANGKKYKNWIPAIKLWS